MSGFEYGALGIVSIISPSSKLRIMHRFFCWIPYSSINIVSKFDNFYQSLDHFLRRLACSSGLLGNSSVFGIFGALV